VVDQNRFDAAQRAYDAKDWRAAAQGFLAAAQQGGEGSAKAYCKAGNALTKMRRWADATTVYRHALADPEYAARGAVWANLGTALSESGEYGEALEAFDHALEDPAYATAWRAMQGRARALVGMGRHDEAAAAYRQAALDHANPDPGRALNNLGLQFMAMGRPEDAVEAYSAALDIDGYGGRGRAAANLGVAYLRLGMRDRAAEALALAEAEGFDLTGPFAQAKDAAGAIGAPPTDTIPTTVVATADPAPESSDGHAAGHPDAESSSARSTAPESVVIGDEQLDTDFFDLTDDDMKRIDRERRRSEPAAPRSRRGLWSTVAATVLVLALAAGLVAAAVLTGFGWPGQTSVTSDLLTAYREGKSVEGYWVAVPAVGIDKEMAKIPPTFSGVNVGTVKNTSLNTATVQVAVTIENGSPLDYVVDLQREGVGWRVSGIENDWRSTDTTP
jgi:Tfp pilus assembly protein PilF